MSENVIQGEPNLYLLTFSQAFELGKSQAELDFVDIPLNADVPLFIDPFAISQRLDQWSQKAHRTLIGFFQTIVDSIRSGSDDRARTLLLHLREPNETHLGLSSGRPQGAGIGPQQAEEIFEALRHSEAVKTGFLSSLEECELMIDGIGRDKISDLTTNIIRYHLADYSYSQCQLHEIPTQKKPLPACYDLESQRWSSNYLELPVWEGKPLLLVPKAIFRFSPAYNHQKYYNHFVLDFLQFEHLSDSSSLVHTFRNGKRRVYKKDLKQLYPCTKDFLYDFSLKHPDVLEQYREKLKGLENRDEGCELDIDDEPVIATSLAKVLQSIPPGSETASDYHRLMVGIVEFLFFPKLLCPIKEKEIHQGRKRIDIQMENGARSGIFYRLHDIQHIPCSYVPFECKNYQTDIANPEIDQLAGRFSVNRGKVGFLCCRQFENRNLFLNRCKDTFTDGRGLLLPLDDKIILTFLELIKNRKRDGIDQHLSFMVREVCGS
ncbi:MAG: hypothetical protein NTY36_06265 [Deltaproteobacteria bacterium]|nr:hypothetical protein [Deltaproteobacteria bacterium]